ncbi:MAG: DUF1844 domain-containing protein [Nitrospirae bacterium]|nr:MAG: DUF1844 domain-containing protein [Nitrospirota bacterium]
MTESEERGFVIRDRRGAVKRDHDTSSSDQSATTTRGPQAAGTPSSDDRHTEKLPVTFSSFVFSLGTSALMFMGEKLTPDQPDTPVNLPQAKEIIDILSILETKTHGNLTSEEKTVLEDLLYTLRMKYVELTSK